MNNIFQHFDRFVCRMPYLPMTISEVEKSGVTDPHDILVLFLNRPEVLEAIYIASPDLYNEVLLFFKGEIAKESNFQRYEKFMYAVLKYVYRMAYRATPFGTFAGVGVGTIGGERNQLAPNESASLRKIVKFDSGVLMAVAEFILNQEDLRPAFRYFTNNTIYTIGEKYRYVEFYMNPDGKRVYNLSSFDKNEYIDTIINACNGGLAFADIVNLLVSADISNDEAAGFIIELISARILISELEPVVVGEEYGAQMLRILERVTTISENPLLLKIYNCLKQCVVLFGDIENAGGFPIDKYKAVEEALTSLGIPFNAKSSFKVDAGIGWNAEPEISAALAADVINGFRYFLRFSRVHESSMLQRFTSDFIKRYEERMVPLTEVMDPEIGIGYGSMGAEMLEFSPLVDDIPIPQRPPKKRVLDIQWDVDKHTFFFNKVLQAYQKDDYVIHLSDEEVKKFSAPGKEIPATVNAYVNLLYDEKGEVLINYLMLGSGTASSMIGRFSILDEQLGELSKKITAYEDDYYKGYVVAEINHLADTRVGNITMRDVFRKYEIPYVTKSNAENQEGIIRVDDLYLLVNNGRLWLYSKQLKKCVIPRLSNSHNYFLNTLPVYKFLSDYQNEIEHGGIDITLDMGHVPEFFAFVPRIQYKQYVFSVARWSFSNTELMEMVAKNDTRSIIELVRNYLRNKRVPRKFYLHENSDNELFFDTESEVSMRLFIYVIAKMKKLYLRECLFNDAKNGLIQNSSGAYCHELLLPLMNVTGKSVFEDEGNAALHIPSYAGETYHTKRTFVPGDDWLFLKVYVGVDVCEKIIVQVLPQYINRLKELQMIDKWFFLRYSDPDHHLRLRVEVKKGAMETVVQLLQQYIENLFGKQAVARMCIDTYTRELERYGFDLTDVAEKVFHYDSELVLRFLEQLATTGGGDEQRWHLSMRVINAYMNAFEMDMEEKYAFVKGVRDDFAVEFNANKMQKRKIVTKFRMVKEQVDSILDEQSGNYTWADAAIAQFRKALNEVYAGSYRDLNRNKQLYYLNSFVHMHIVRLFRSKNRITEYILYSYFEQYLRYKLGEAKHLMHAN